MFRVQKDCFGKSVTDLECNVQLKGKGGCNFDPLHNEGVIQTLSPQPLCTTFVFPHFLQHEVLDVYTRQRIQILVSSEMKPGTWCAGQGCGRAGDGIQRHRWGRN